MRHLPLLGLALVLAFPLAGCGRENALTAPPGASNAAEDQADIESTLASSPDVMDESTFTSDEESTTDEGGLTASVRRALRFWRRITEVHRRYEFAFSDPDSSGRPTTALVTVHTLLSGTFNIRRPDPADSTGSAKDDSLVIHKRLRDHAVRHVMLKRVRVNDAGRALWKIVAVSGVRVRSEGAVTNIESLRIRSASHDTTITNPLELRRLRRILTFDAGERVELTVTTTAKDDVVLLVRPAARFGFHNNGDGTYTGRWLVPAVPGIKLVGVNALSHGTLFDDQAPYDSEAWLFHFAVRPTEIADALP
jgi:predicted small lipoprotein YifL